ncbi:MAG TPA: HU family DNA-binding protein [Chloroflexota bacterium]|nr:HU family DNA-binding protein [Chloroflexota bacterium]
MCPRWARPEPRNGSGFSQRERSTESVHQWIEVQERMTKSDLIQRVAKETGLSLAQSGKVVNGVFDAITNALKSGEEVRVTGFGTFKVTQTAQRTGRNPRTGEQITIPASKRPSFSAGAALVEAVRGGKS